MLTYHSLSVSPDMVVLVSISIMRLVIFRCGNPLSSFNKIIDVSNCKRFLIEILISIAAESKFRFNKIQVGHMTKFYRKLRIRRNCYFFCGMWLIIQNCIFAFPPFRGGMEKLTSQGRFRRYRRQVGFMNSTNI